MSKDIKTEDNWNKAIAIIKQYYRAYMFRRFHQTDEMANALADDNEEKVDELNTDWTIDYLFEHLETYLTSPFKVEKEIK